MSQRRTGFIQLFLGPASSLLIILAHTLTASAAGKNFPNALGQPQSCPKGFMLELLSDNSKPDVAREQLIIAYATSHCRPENGLATELQVKAAAKNDHPVALVILGMSYDTQPETTQDRHTADRYYKRAAYFGNRLAMHYLGLNQLRRSSSNPNQQKGLKWLTKAARSGHAISAMLLGQIHEHGRYGVKRNACRAKTWYLLAEANGMPSANRHAARIQLTERCNTQFAHRWQDEHSQEAWRTGP